MTPGLGTNQSVPFSSFLCAGIDVGQMFESMWLDIKGTESLISLRLGCENKITCIKLMKHQQCEPSAVANQTTSFIHYKLSNKLYKYITLLATEKSLNNFWCVSGSLLFSIEHHKLKRRVELKERKILEILKNHFGP